MKQSNLVLHCGARKVTREQLAGVRTPDATDTWHPIPHVRMVTEVERSLASSGLRIVTESFGITEDQARMFGLLQVARVDAEVTDGDYACVIGLRGSHNKSLSRGFAVGSSVFVCDNLAFSSEIVFHRKSTKNIERDLPVMVDTAIGQLSQRWNDQATRIDTYKRTEIGNKDAAYLLMEMAGDVFPAQKLPNIYSEFKTPRHTEFGKDNVWALFNAVTEFLKPGEDSAASGLWTMPARTGRLHKVCDDFSGLAIDTAPAVVGAPELN